MITVAIIEDNASNMKLLDNVLRRAGYKTVMACDGKSGVQLVRSELPDIILMDIHMPGTDGIVATRQLKAESLTKHIPIIAVTARAMDEDKQLIMNAGCDGYAVKPYRYQELLAQIEQLVSPC